jgi:hypothetical protein
VDVADDDPLMQAARRKAADSLERFRTLAIQHPHSARE